MGPWIRLGAIALLVTGCAATAPVMPPEIKSMLDFGAYPGGTKVEEHVNDPGPPTPWSGYYGSRTYETDHTPEQVRTHYETLAKTHGWSLEGPSPPPSAQPNEPNYLVLRRTRFTLSIDIRKSDFSYSYPAPSTDPNAKTRVQVNASSQAQ